MQRNISDSKQKKKNESSWYNVLSWFQTTSSTHAGFVCSETQCTIIPSHPNTQASFTYFSTYHEDDLFHDVENESTDLASILPPDYYEAIQQAAKLGFLYSFLSSTPIEFFTDYFKSRKWSSNQIYYANQAIRAISILALSSYIGLLDAKSLCLIMGTPLASCLLDYAGATESVSQLVPMGLIISAELLSDISNAALTGATIAVSSVSGWLGTKASHLTHNMICQGFFAIKDQFYSSEKHTADSNHSLIINEDKKILPSPR